MKAVVIHQYGGPEVLQFEDYPDPEPSAGEVLLEVIASSINPVDAMERAGDTKAWNPIKFPGVLGWDVAGKIIKLGPDVTNLEVGDNVCGWSSHTYATLCAVKASLVVKIPAGLDTAESAALPLVGITGSQLISVAGEVKAGQTVLVSGAAGGVGRAAVYTALDRGAIVTAGVQKNRVEEARKLGAHQVVALSDDAALSALAPFDVVANTVRGQTSERLMNVVKAGGIFVSVTGAPANAKQYPDVRVVAFVSKNDVQTLGYVVSAVHSGKLTIPIGLTLRLSEASRGHEALAKGGAGKILLLP